MEPSASAAAVENVMAFLVAAGFDVHRSSGHERTILGVVGDVTRNDVEVVSELPGVTQVVRVSEPFRMASRRFRSSPTVLSGSWGSIGGERPWIAIEPILPHVSNGGGEALSYEVAAGRAFDAAVTRSELTQEHNFGALSWLSIHHQPSRQPGQLRFVERGPSWGANAWIIAAERELVRGDNVVLLEAGGEYPNGARTLEIAAIARAKQRTHLPIVVDVPSIAQRARYCHAVACAAIAAGADGVILRVFVGKEKDIPRVPAALRWETAVRLAETLRAIGAAVRQ